MQCEICGKDVGGDGQSLQQLDGEIIYLCTDDVENLLDIVSVLAGSPEALRMRGAL